jgi:glycosyltransferase involved in cell wall biosynthesis
MTVEVVIPVYNGARTLGACLSALAAQTLPAHEFDVIVVDDGSTDDSAGVARRFARRVVSQTNAGAPAARNAGIRAATAEFVAFTDADCVPSRTWLARLLEAAQREPSALGAAGKTVGYRSESAAARFVDLMGGLDAARNLAHPVFPFAPSANVLYRRCMLVEAGGFDERYATYDACDLHTRLRARFGNVFAYEPRALVLHRHRDGWRSYWRQQVGYGVGYAQFLIAHSRDTAWTLRRELRALGEIAACAPGAVLAGRGDAAIVRRGRFVRAAAQHVGFLRTYYRRSERARW